MVPSVNTQNDQLYTPFNTGSVTLLPTACCAHAPRSPRASLCLSASPSWAALAWYSWSLLSQCCALHLQAAATSHSLFCGRLLQLSTGQCASARATVELFCCAMRDFIAPDLWPPDSPGLNPMDYRIWAVLQKRVYQLPVVRRR